MPFTSSRPPGPSRPSTPAGRSRPATSAAPSTPDLPHGSGAGWILVLLALTLGACAAVPPNDADVKAKALFQQYAGPPIDSFTYLGRYDSFRTLGRNDLVVWASINDAYLIHVLDPCTRLPFANGIGLTSTNHTVDRRFDWVTVGTSPADRCRISEIRKVDYLKMKQDGKAGP